MSRKRRKPFKWTPAIVREVKRLLRLGFSRIRVCEIIGISESQLDYARLPGKPLAGIKSRRGKGRKHKGRQDDEESGRLFGCPFEEWNARKNAIRGW